MEAPPAAKKEVRGGRGRRPLGRLSEAARIEAQKLRNAKRREEARARIEHIPHEERLAAVAQRVVASKSKGDKCDKCWLRQPLCMCPIPPLASPHHFSVYMHYKGEFLLSFSLVDTTPHLEYRVGSNTGKLLLGSPHSRLFIMGIEKDEKELVNSIVGALDRTVVLFPTRDALTVNQYRPRRPSGRKKIFFFFVSSSQQT